MTFDPRIARALLHLAAESGHRSMTRTFAVKLIYLLDVLVARETEGRERYTPWTWKFVHYGPYCAEAVEIFERDDYIDTSTFERSDGEGEGTLYTLRNTGTRAVTLDDLGVSVLTRMALARLIKDYASDLPRLLDHVYFRTEPMAEARHGDVLQFSTCRKTTINDIRPLAFPAFSAEQKRKARELIAAAREARLAEEKARAPVTTGALDDVYFLGLAELTGDPLPQGFAGQAEIVEGLDGNS